MFYHTPIVRFFFVIVKRKISPPVIFSQLKVDRGGLYARAFIARVNFHYFRPWVRFFCSGVSILGKIRNKPLGGKKTHLLHTRRACESSGGCRPLVVGGIFPRPVRPRRRRRRRIVHSPALIVQPVQ